MSAARTAGGTWIVGRGPRGTALAAAFRALGRAAEPLVWWPTPAEAGPGSAEPPLAERLAAARPARVVVCTPTASHEAVVRTALAAAAAVLCEAPLCADAAAAAALARTAAAAGAALGCAHVSAHHPPVLALLAYAVSHRLGAVQSVYAYRFGPLPADSRRHHGVERLHRLLLPHVTRAKVLAVLPEWRMQRVRFHPAEDAEDLQVQLTYEDEILVALRHVTESGPVREGLMVTCEAGVLRWTAEAGVERLTRTQLQAERTLRFPAGSADDQLARALVSPAGLGALPFAAPALAAGVAGLLERIVDG